MPANGVPPALDSALGAVVPPGIAWAQTSHDLAEPLFPAEAESIRDAVERRVHEFTTVRACARHALAELGFERGPMVTGGGRGPDWPDGVVGSLTHCDGYRAAAVGYRGQWLTIGIDAEPDLPLPAGVLDEVCCPAERQGLRELQAADPSHAWPRMLFSAKESVYKAWWPLMHVWFGFEEVRIELHLDQTFTVVPVSVNARRCPPIATTGRWRAASGLIVTSLTVAH